MTELNIRLTRHVPDDELHAYLDQALSRSQCVEIETHLAVCARCSDNRDANAAMRDRTTALLAQITPRALIIPPPYASLEERRMLLPHFSRVQRALRRSGMAAAGIVAALGAGWAGRSFFDPPQVTLAAVQTPAEEVAAADLSIKAVPLESIEAVPLATVAVAPDFVPADRPLPARERNPRRSTVRSVTVREPEAVIVPAPVIQFISSVLPTREPVGEISPAPRLETVSSFERIWRRVSWEEALKIAGSGLPFIEGMPVIGVLLQPGSGGERPTVIVAQQDGTGEVIQSIEGPVAKVFDLLKRQSAPDVFASSASRTPPDYVEDGGVTRRGIRILTVTGRLTVDSLNALAKVATIR
jgi:hypothetical protein